MLLAALLALSIGRQQPATLSFTCRAESMAQLVVDLGKAMGQKLSVSKECADDVLLISVSDVPQSKLLSEIARVDAGTWQKAGDGQKFVADPAARRLEARNELGSRARILTKDMKEAEMSIAKMRQFAAKHAGSAQPDDPENPGFNWNTSANHTEAVLKLLEGLDPEDLVLNAGQRAVFSSRPTSTQRGLGADSGEVLSTLVEQLKLENSQLQPGSEASTQPIEGYDKADLVVTNGFGGSTISAELTIYGPRGTKSFELEQPFNLPFPEPDDSTTSDDAGTAGATSGAPPPNLTSSQTSDPIRVGVAASAFRQTFQSQRRGSTPTVPLPPVILPYLTDLEHHDPLSLTPSDELLAVAKAKKKPLVAVIPDSSFVDLAPAAPNSSLERVDDFWNELSNTTPVEGSPMVASESGGWIEVRPTNPATERFNRCPRAELGTFLRTCFKQTFPTLDQFGQFTLDTPRPSENTIVLAYCFVGVSGYGSSGVGALASWDMYRIYAELTPDQKSRLAAGARFPLSILGSNQMQNLMHLAYGDAPELHSGKAPAPMTGRFPTNAQLNTFEEGQIGYEDEPTELLPSGPDSNGIVQMQVVDEPFVIPVGVSESDENLPRVWGVAQVARRAFGSAVVPTSASPGSRFVLPTYDRYRLGSRSVLALAIHTSNRSFVTGRLYEFHYDPNSKVLSNDELPEDWKAEVARRVADFVRSRQKQTEGQPPAGLPPPK